MTVNFPQLSVFQGKSTGDILSLAKHIFGLGLVNVRNMFGNLWEVLCILQMSLVMFGSSSKHPGTPRIKISHL